MLDSEFWRDLSAQFRALPDPEHLLTAYWISEPNKPLEWTVQTPQAVWGGIALRANFEALAARGGAKIDNPNRRDLVSAWLDALNREIPSDEFTTESLDLRPIRSKGNIRRICEASATFCKILERKALENEAAISNGAGISLEAERERQAAALLETHPGFFAATARMYQSLQDANIAQKLGATASGSDERMDIALNALKLRAEAYLDLADDLPLLKAYVVSLNKMVRTAWTEFADFPIEDRNQASPEAQHRFNQIINASRHWENEAIKRLAAKREQTLTERPARDEDSPSNPKLGRRAEWLRERLREREWDRNRPAEFGGPDRKTVNRILDGLPVHDGSIDKLIIALNKHRTAPKVTSSDVPND